MQVLGDGGVPIDVRVEGAGASVIVLLAGFPLTRDIWSDVVPQLAGEHRVALVDLRGTGASGVSDGPYLMESLAADVAAVLDALGAERAAIAGHSMGGYVALAFARMFTERLERLALVCSRLTADAPEQARERERLAQRLDDGDVDALVAAFVPRLLAPQTREQRPDLVARVETMARSLDPRGAAALLRGMAMRASCEDLAPDLDMPVAIVAGGADFVPLGEARAMASAFPDASLTIAERSGHIPMVEEPAVVSGALSDWMGRMTAASDSGS